VSPGGTPLSGVTIRRGAGACLGVSVACAAWLVAGLGLTLMALIAAVVCLAGAGAVGRHRSERRPGWRLRVDLATIPIAVLSWALVAAVDLAARAARVIRTGEVLHPLRGARAVALAGGPLVAPWGMVVDVLVGGALISSLFVARALRRRPPLEGGSPQEALDRARGIVDAYGADSLSPFILRPDKSFEFAGGGVLAYRVIGETAVVSGDPVGPDAAAGVVLARLAGRARQAGLQVALYGASERHLRAYRALGLRALCVGEEAVVDPARFTLEGRPVRKLRQSVHRVGRRGWQITIHEGREIDTGLENEIDAVEVAWRAEHPHMLGFAMCMGEFELCVRPDDVYVLGRSPEGDIQAVMRFIGHRGKLSLDTMRRVGETPNGLNEALVCAVLEFARARGVPEVSLNYAGLAHLVRLAPSGKWLSRTLTAALIKPLRARFQMDRLVQFNEKFSPEWRPRYLVYESRAALPRTVLRVLQAEGYVPQRRAGRRARSFDPWRAPASSTRIEGGVSR
jgi:lysyl-tRNA synthetase, class II